MGEKSKAAEMRTGLVVIIALVVLTAAEFAVGVATNGLFAPLAVIALVKAALIIHYFMHAPRVLRYDEEGGGH
jgi:hypothetical protein